ncbi:MAG: TRAP transporter substrate-binding protein [Beijerinckiaceae bacterium]
MTKIHKLVAGACFVTVLGGLSHAAEKTVTLRFTHFLPTTQKLNVGFNEWNEALKKASDGTLSFKMFPASILGSARDHYDMIKRRNADMGLINPGYSPGRFPVVGAINLPFMVGNGWKGAKGMTRYYTKYAPKEMSDIKMCHVFSHEPGTFHSNKPIRVPSDVKDMKIRTASSIISQYVIAMGGNSVQVPIMESFETLKRGIVDGITVPWNSLITFNFGKVTRYHLDAELYVVVFVTGINKVVYDNLSDNHKAAFDSTCTPDWAQRVYKAWYDQELELRATIMKEGKSEILSIGPKEVALWRKAAEPIYSKWGEDIKKRGYNPDNLLSELRDELKKEGALAR